MHQKSTHKPGDTLNVLREPLKTDITKSPLAILKSRAIIRRRLKISRALKCSSKEKWSHETDIDTINDVFPFRMS